MMRPLIAVALITLVPAPTPSELARGSNRSMTIHAVAYSPDGKSIVTAGMCRPISLRDPLTGKEIRRLAKTASWEGTAAFTPDGRYVLSAGRSDDGANGDGDIMLFPTAATGETRVVGRVPNGEWVLSLAVSPDGKTVASASLNAPVILWNLASGKEIRRLECKGIRWSLSFSPDGKLLASASGDEKTVRIWETASGKELGPLPHPSCSVAFSPDGKVFAAGMHPTIKIWDVNAWKELRSLQGGAFCMAFSPDGRLLAAGSQIAPKIDLWDVATGKRVGEIKAAGEVTTLAFSPDGKKIAAGVYGKLQIWETEGGKELLTLSLPPNERD